MTILLVDDDDHVLRIYSSLFGDEGYEVIQAKNGKEALEIFQNEESLIDIVVLDILLPDVDGIRILRSMKDLLPKIPVIMHSAYDYRDDFAVWLSEAYIVKSSDPEELLETIKKLAGK